MRRPGELERAVMDVLRDADRPCTAKEVLAASAAGSPPRLWPRVR